MTDQPQPRKHLAKRWWGKNGLIIRCTCGQWESRRGDTRRQQDDAHRAHRIDMDETVRPRKLTRVEQMEAEIDHLRAELQQAQQQRDHAFGLLLHYAATAHSRKWMYSTGDDGRPSDAFAALHQLGTELKASLDRLTTPAS